MASPKTSNGPSLKSPTRRVHPGDARRCPEWNIRGRHRKGSRTFPFGLVRGRTSGVQAWIRRLIDGQAWQIQALRHDQPWGIFLLEFANDAHFTAGGGLHGADRLAAAGAPRPRAQSPPRFRPTGWQRENLLFICTHDYRQFRFAYFKAPKDDAKLAPLAAFGWNQGDSHIRTVCEFNLPALAWPADDGTGSRRLGETLGRRL